MTLKKNPDLFGVFLFYTYLCRKVKNTSLILRDNGSKLKTIIFVK